MAKFKVKDVRKVPSPDDNRVGRMDHLITYELDPFRVYMVRVPKEEVTEPDIVAAVKADLASIEQFIGKELSTD